MQNNPFTEANIIVTGAASGIGEELFRQLTYSNPEILAVDFDRNDLERLQSKFPELHILHADLSQKSGNDEIISCVTSNWNRVDFCFENAGKAEFAPAESQNWKEMDQLFLLNLQTG